MTTTKIDSSTSQQPLRLWPGVIAVALQWLIWFGVTAVAPDAMMGAIIGAAACALAVLVWWLFFSRAPWVERLGAIALRAGSAGGWGRVVLGWMRGAGRATMHELVS